MDEHNNSLGFEKDVIHSAALAFHKAIIGVVQLNELECNNQRLPRAIIAYYAVYHVFTLCMLLDLDDSVKKINPCNLNELNSRSELPEQWNLQRELEADYATQIKHRDIKRYCEQIRKKGKDKLTSIERILFENFIKQPINEHTPCINGLYEKLCYVRDRAIYRPSVVKLTNGGYAQTSLNVKKEIDSLPSGKELYRIIKSIYMEFISKAKQIKKYNHLLACIWCYPVDCGIVFNELNDNEAELMRSLTYFDNENGFNAHICHLLELYDDIYQIKKYEELYWRPLFEAFLKMREQF